MSKTIYTDPTRFYVYAFLREDGSPYYIGKGQGNRAWVKRKNSPVDVSRIVLLKERLTESEAFDLECELIKFHGRKDLGTGILTNLTDGGEGSSGCKGNHHTLDTKTKISESNTGKKRTPEAKAKMSAAKTGKCLAPETKIKMSEAKIGEKHPMFGKTHTQESKAKMSAAHSGEKSHMFGKRWSAESIATRKRNKEAKDNNLHMNEALKNLNESDAINETEP
jgi:hypothetical protein